MIVEKLEKGKTYEFTANVVEMEFEAVKEWCKKNDYIMIYQTGVMPRHYVYWLVPGDVYKADAERKFLYGEGTENPVGILPSVKWWACGCGYSMPEPLNRCTKCGAKKASE